MSFGIHILNPGRFIKPSKFKRSLTQNSINFTQIQFNITAHAFVELVFATLEDAESAKTALESMQNYKSEPFKVKILVDFTPTYKPQKHQHQPSTTSESEEEIPQTPYFQAPYYSPESTADENLQKQRTIRNSIKSQFVRIIKGQTLTTDKMQNVPQLQNFKKSPKYLQTEQAKSIVYAMPEVVPSDVKYNYRTKSEFSVKEGKIGAFCRKNDEIFVFSAAETRKTRIHAEKVSEICEFLEGKISQKCEGMATFRVSGNIQADIFVVEQILLKLDLDEVVEISDLQSKFPEISGLIVITPNSKQQLYNEYIVQKMFGMEFQIYPESFFQSNISAAEKIFSYVSSLIPSDAKTVLDCCSGTGIIGRIVKKFHPEIEISGIDICEEAINTAKSYEIGNYVCGAIEDNLKMLEVDFVVLDPPRAGIHPKVLKNLRSGKLNSILYVSCNPKSLGKDLFVLCALSGGKFKETAPFMVKSVKGFNAFPGCEHVEVVVQLERAWGEIENSE